MKAALNDQELDQIYREGLSRNHLEGLRRVFEAGRGHTQAELKSDPKLSVERDRIQADKDAMRALKQGYTTEDNTIDPNPDDAESRNSTREQNKDGGMTYGTKDDTDSEVTVKVKGGKVGRVSHKSR